MNINFKNATIVLFTVAVTSLGAGYKLASRETLDPRKLISATIESIKSESRLISYSYVGTQNVSIQREYWRLFEGHQQLIVPATISYFIDLERLTESSASFDESTNTLSVALPKLMLSVNLDSRRATIINNGVPMLWNGPVQDLQNLNYDMAVKSAIKQGQQPELVRLAKENTVRNMERLFRVPLHAAGKADVKIKVLFAD